MTHSRIPSPPPLDYSWKTRATDLNDRLHASVKPEKETLRKLKCDFPLWIRSGALDLGQNGLYEEPFNPAVSVISICRNGASPLREESNESAKPTGIGQLSYKSTPNLQAMLSFAGLEIACCEISEQSQDTVSNTLDALNIQWPIDVETPSHFSSKSKALRSLFDHPIGVGISLPIVDTSDDFFKSIQWLSECPLDWITWRLPAACLGENHPALSCFADDPFDALKSIKKWQKTIYDQASDPPAIAIEYPWHSGYHAGQIIRDGADIAVLPNLCSIVEQAVNASQDSENTSSDPSGAYPSGSFGATLGHSLSPFSHSSPFAFSNTNDREGVQDNISEKSGKQPLEEFVHQMHAFLKWSQ